MSVADIERRLDSYRRWLKDQTTLREIDDWVEITTPLLDRHNDSLQIFARGENGGYLLTDDSYIINDLEASRRRWQAVVVGQFDRRNHPVTFAAYDFGDRRL